MDRALTPMTARRPATEYETIGGMWNDYLELLAADAAAIEYEGPVLAARARGESAADMELLERGKAAALRVRDKFLTQQRRGNELTALYETANDLARLTDLDSVLEAIVHRARQVLGTDVAYLSMNDSERGDTYMRVTDGSTSAAFQQVRLPMGKGLGGRVAQKAMPYATSSYFEDDRFDHTHDIDSAVDDEGLVAILGVPLRLGSHVIGVLYASNRSKRPFSQAEVALLGSLAAHASAAIDKARLLDETRIALRELRAVNVLLRDHGEAVERASAAHDRMAQLVLRGGGVEDVALALVEVIGGPLLVLDEEGRILNEVGGIQGPAEPDFSELIVASQSSGHAAELSIAGTTWWACAITAGPQHLGALVLQRTEMLDDADQRILESAAVVTALLMLSLRSGVEAEDKVRGELLDDILRDGPLDTEGLTDRAHRLGNDLSVPQTVYAIDPEGTDRLRLARTVAGIAGKRGGLSGPFGGKVVLVVPGTDPGSVARDLARELKQVLGHPVTVGGAGPVTELQAINTAHTEATRCVGALQALGRSGDGADASELGFVGLVLGEQPDVHGFIVAMLGPLLDYDARRGSVLIETLRVYFAAGCSLSRTHDLLHVHVNTVTQRLERIGRLIGVNWQQPERQLELQVALRLHRVSASEGT